MYLPGIIILFGLMGPGEITYRQEVVTPVVAQRQQNVYVYRQDAVLRAGPNARDEVIAQLPMGAPLVVLEQQGARFRVRTQDGREGFVSRLQVSEDPPKTDESSLISFVDSRGVGTDERQNVAAIRGLSPMQTARDSGRISAQTQIEAERYFGFYDMISEQEVDNFIRRGNIIEP